MLAVRVNRYLPYDNQFVVAFAPICKCLEYRGRVLLITSSPMSPGTRNPVGGFDQSLAFGIFPDRAQQSPPVGYAEFRVM